LHLNEIEIYNKQGQNIALNGKCFSKTIGYGGDPNTLNDGIVGTYPQTGNSHSSWMDPGNYDYCVLEEASDISAIKIYPFVDPTRTWMTDRLRNLKVEVFASIQTDESDETEFLGLMYSYDMVDVFSRSSTGPHTNSTVTLQNEIECPNTGEANTSLTYQTLYGETWVAIPPVKDTTSAAKTIKINIGCSLSKCNENFFLDNGVCVKCPNGSYSEAGATSVSQCSACPGGTTTLPNQSGCFLSETWESFVSAKGWRIWAPDYHIISGWAWDVEVLELYEDENCQGSRIFPSGTAIASGSANESWGPDGAFDGFAWGGRPDSDGVFWLGMLFSSDVTVRCVKMKHYGDKPASEMRIQAYDGSVWKNAYIKKNLLPSSDMNIIPLLAPPGGPPVPSPSTPSPVISTPPTPPPPSPVVVTPSPPSIESSKGWRIWTPASKTSSGWAWDINVLEFYENENCQGNRIDPSGTAISSGYANEDWRPEGAFDGFAWGGRADDDGNFWLGMMFSSDVTVRCIKMVQYGNKPANEMTIQAYDGVAWKNVYTAHNLLPPGDVNIVPFRWTSKGWRIFTNAYFTTSGWAWDIDILEFYENENCQGNRIDPSGTAISSGYANEDWRPEGAFDGFAWGGRADDDGNFWLGMMFSSDVTVRCIKMVQYGNKPANEMRVQLYDGSSWKSIHTAHNLLPPGDVNIIGLN